MADPHECAPHRIKGHLDSNKCEQDRTINYVEFLAFAVVGGAVRDAVHGCKEYGNLHSFLMRKIRTNGVSVMRVLTVKDSTENGPNEERPLQWDIDGDFR